MQTAAVTASQLKVPRLSGTLVSKSTMRRRKFWLSYCHKTCSGPYYVPPAPESYTNKTWRECAQSARAVRAIECRVVNGCLPLCGHAEWERSERPERYRRSASFDHFLRTLLQKVRAA